MSARRGRAGVAGGAGGAGAPSAGAGRGPRDVALRLLGARALTVHELRTRLAKRGFAADEVAGVCERLLAAGLLDDAALARRAAEAELARRAAGPRLVLMKLLRRGVERATAEAAVAAVFGERDAGADADREAARAVRRLPASVDAAAAWRRVAGALARRGFDAATARAAAERALAGRAFAPPARRTPRDRGR